MSIWSILSWIGVALLTGINIFIFMKLQSTMKSMMMNMFPGASSVEDAASKMANMMKMFSGNKGPLADNPLVNNKNLNNALDMLTKLQTKHKR